MLPSIQCAALAASQVWVGNSDMSKLRVLLGSVAVSVGVQMVMGLVGVAAPAQADLGRYQNTGARANCPNRSHAGRFSGVLLFFKAFPVINSVQKSTSFGNDHTKWH